MSENHNSTASDSPLNRVPRELLRRQIQALKYGGYCLQSLEQAPLPESLFSELPLTNDTADLVEAGLVFDLSKRITNEGSYGLDDRPPHAKGQMKLLFLSTLKSRNLGEMLQKQTELMSYMERDNEFATARHKQLVCAGFCRNTYPECIPAHLLQASDSFHLYWWYRSYCWLINEIIPLREVQLMGPDDGFGDQLTTLFGSSVEFLQPAYRILFEPEFLSRPVNRTEQEIEFFFNNIGAACQQYPSESSTAEQVGALLAQYPLDAPVNLEIIAEKLCCSRQTLIRRLRVEQSSFQSLKDKRRRKAANQLLSGSDLSINEISATLGFANNSAFTRAYRKWTGLSPSQARTMAYTK